MEKEIEVGKRCPVCKTVKSKDEFGKYFSKERQKYRLQNYCNDCQKIVKPARSKEYFERHKEERLQYAKDYRADPKNKEKLEKLSAHFKKKYREELQPCYVADQLGQKWGMSATEIRKIPGLLEGYKANLLLKRTIKQYEKHSRPQR